MEIFHYKECEAEAAHGGEGISIRWVIDKGENFSMRVVEMEPGTEVSRHSHPWEHEVFILKGTGLVDSGGRECTFKEGDVIYIAPDEEHSFRNSSDGEVEFICLIPNSGVIGRE